MSRVTKTQPQSDDPDGTGAAAVEVPPLGLCHHSELYCGARKNSARALKILWPKLAVDT